MISTKPRRIRPGDRSRIAAPSAPRLARDREVEVQLFATLQPYLPPGAVGDQAYLELPDGSTVAQVQPPSYSDHFSCLTVVNGHDASPDQVLTPGDVVACFPLAGGL